MKQLGVFLSALLLCVFATACNSSNNQYRDMAEKAKESAMPSRTISNGSDGDTYQWEDEEQSKDISGGFASQVVTSTNGNTATLAQNLPKQIDPNPQETPKAKIPKKVIKTGVMGIEVKNYEKARAQIDGIAKKHGAYISNEVSASNDYSLQTNYTFRVAPQQFDDLVKSIEALAMNVDHKSVNAKDVGEQFNDIQTRLRTKRQVIQRYEAILKQARTIKDILEVEEKLRRVTEEVESLEGRLRYLSDQVSLSTLQVDIYENIVRSPMRKSNFGKRLAMSFKQGWGGLGNFLIELASVWPFLIVVGIGAWFLVRAIRGTNKRVKRKSEEKVEEKK